MSTQLIAPNTITPPVPSPVAPLKLEPPSFAELLTRALSEPGSLMQAYSAFHNYSFGNQLLAAFQCGLRGIPTGPINTFPGWKDLGRSVKKGEKALTLCMPITVKRRNASSDDEDSDESFATFFVYKRRWFVLSQTEGPDIELPPLPNWDPGLALQNLDITQVPFMKPNGNCQGYARLCCRQHKRAYVAKSVMWRSAFLSSSQQQPANRTPHKFKAQSARRNGRGDGRRTMLRILVDDIFSGR